MRNYTHINFVDLSSELLESYENETLAPVCFNPQPPESVDFVLQKPLRSRYTEAKNHGIELNINSMAQHVGCSTSTARRRYMADLSKKGPTAASILFSHTDRWACLADSTCTQGRVCGSFERDGWESYLRKSVTYTLR